MRKTKFAKFIRPEEVARGEITDRALDILAVVLRYRFTSAAHIVRLVGGNEDVTHRHLRRLWEWGLLNRWAFPGMRSHSEFFYYLDDRKALELLAERRGLEIHPQMTDEIRNNREKNYSGAAIAGQHMQLGFLQHSLMLSRLHFMLELGAKALAGQVALAAWSQGSALAGHKVEVAKIVSSREGSQMFWQEHDSATERLPVEPDAMFTLRFSTRPEASQLGHFLYEADRGTMTMTDMLRKFRGYYHFVKKQQRHKDAFGIHPIRAVLIETTDEARARRLLKLITHPLVSGPDRRAGLFWVAISPLFTDRVQSNRGALPRYLVKPEVVFDRLWALPDLSLHALSDLENSHAATAVAG